jgi:hypothetical protein
VEWIPDLQAFIRICASYLKPGGRLVLIDAHPLAHSLMRAEDGSLYLIDSYFGGPEPERCRVRGSYTDRAAPIRTSENYKWRYSIADIISSMLTASLTITAFEERPVLHYRKFPTMIRRGPWYEWSEGPRLPLLFGIRAEKPEEKKRMLVSASRSTYTMTGTR